LILEQVMHVLDVGEVTFSSNALREGVLLDTWRRRHGGSLHHLSDLRRRSVLQLAGRMDEDPAHSAQVADLALQLFDATAGLHGLGDDSREVLHAAALLANVGLFVSHAGHHRHSYYLIRNSELLLGFTDHEIELIALVARYHRKSHPKRKHPEFAALAPEDQRRVRVLAGLLRVAVGLDRNHGARVAAVGARTDGDRLVVEAGPAEGQDVSLELYAANARSALLSEALDRPVAVVARAGAEPEPLGAPACAPAAPGRARRPAPGYSRRPWRGDAGEEHRDGDGPGARRARPGRDLADPGRRRRVAGALPRFPPPARPRHLRGLRPRPARDAHRGERARPAGGRRQGGRRRARPRH